MKAPLLSAPGGGGPLLRTRDARKEGSALAKCGSDMTTFVPKCDMFQIPAKREGRTERGESGESEAKQRQLQEEEEEEARIMFVLLPGKACRRSSRCRSTRRGCGGTRARA